MTTDHGFIVRAFEKADIPQLLDLMKQLARFEHYIDEFAITEDDLRDFGLGTNPAFEALVSVCSTTGKLNGMAAIHQVKWTYDLKPTIVLKELFVLPGQRACGVGAGLFDAVVKRARQIGAGRMKWDVLAHNEPAKAFYEKMGAASDQKWQPWILSADAISNWPQKDIL